MPSGDSIAQPICSDARLCRTAWPRGDGDGLTRAGRQHHAAGVQGLGGRNENPTTPGYHKLVYSWQENGQERQMPFVLYLPEGYDAAKKWPLLVFLAGMGERGSDPAAVMNCGVPVDLGGRPEVRKWLPMMMLFPLCPSDRTWDMPDMPPIVVNLIRSSLTRWPVNADKVYVTGLSMGGRGCWALAREAPDLFAVSAPLVGRELEPETTAKQLSKSQTTFLVISGLMDNVSEPDSRHMVEALRQYPLDVVYAPVPRANHFLWPQYYGSKEFYEWLLLHEKGKPRPTARASADDLIGLFYVDQKGSQEFREKLQQEFSTSRNTGTSTTAPAREQRRPQAGDGGSEKRVRDLSADA